MASRIFSPCKNFIVNHLSLATRAFLLALSAASVCAGCSTDAGNGAASGGTPSGLGGTSTGGLASGGTTTGGATAVGTGGVMSGGVTSGGAGGSGAMSPSGGSTGAGAINTGGASGGVPQANGGSTTSGGGTTSGGNAGSSSTGGSAGTGVATSGGAASSGGSTSGGKGGGGASSGAGGASTGGKTAGGAANCDLPATVSFKQHVQPFLITACGGGNGCHVVDASSTSSSGGYNHAYDWITGGAHTSSCPSGPMRFEIVLDVINAANPASCSKSRKMPPPDATGAGLRAPLTACQVETLRAWLSEPLVTQTHRADDSSPTTPYPMPPFN